MREGITVTHSARLGKARMGIPPPRFPRDVDLRKEARVSRRRLYPTTIVYSGTAGGLLGVAVAARPAEAMAAAVLGVATWTLFEYLAHRYVLHGRFPPGPSGWSRFLNRRFDHLHWEHHERPWDGLHINGTLQSTLLVVLPLGSLALLAPGHFASAWFAGFLQAYVLEEWCHHATHFYVLPFAWFRRLKARHLYHHSQRGANILFGLSNGFWDDALGTVAPDPEAKVAGGRRRTVARASRCRRFPCPYSDRSATSGSTPVARDAGR